VLRDGPSILIGADIERDSISQGRGCHRESLAKSRQ
jgi:hypothetical protein